MYQYVKLLMLILAVVAVLTIGAQFESAAQTKQPPRGPFTGVPRDIDFIRNLGWTQVILQGVPSDQLIAQTKNDRIQSVLLVALSLKSQVTVEYVEETPKKLTSVALPVTTGKEEEGYVLALSVDEKDSYCRATVFHKGKKVNAWTKSAQMQSILETAVRQSVPVKEFTFDPTTMEINRGKINVDLQK